MPSIKVYVIDYGRKYLQFQWTDPSTGRRLTKSSKCTIRRKAERKAGELEKQLNAHRHAADGSLDWTAFRDRVFLEYTAGLARKTRLGIEAILGRFEAHCLPKRLWDLNEDTLSTHVISMRNEGRSEDTIKSHLRHLHAIAQWAVDQKLIPAIPAFPKIRRVRKSKEMKGRPITEAEFQRMLAAVPAVVTKKRAESWRHYLTGLWLSSLRLGESLALTWDGFGLRVEVVANRVRLRIPGTAQKSGEDQVYPVAPDFARWLLETPARERHGFVFNPQSTKGRQNNPFDVGRIISEIGERAKVVVDVSERRDGSHREKFASAHDFRRSFGSRWALRVMPVVLQKLMRHAHVSTSMKYYVLHEVEDTERLLETAERLPAYNTLHNTGHTKRPRNRKKTPRK